MFRVPKLTATRLTRELREPGHTGTYTAVKGFVAAIHSSDRPKPFEVRFETPPGHRAQVYFARFIAVFEDEPGITPIICLFDGALPFPAHRWCTGVISSILLRSLRML